MKFRKREYRHRKNMKKVETRESIATTDIHWDRTSECINILVYKCFYWGSL